MNKTILIIIGIVCLIILIILIAAIIPRLKAAVSRTPLWAYILMILLVIGLLAFVGIQLFGPKGQDSLFSADAEGTEVGDAQEDTLLKEKSDAAGTHFNVAKALEGNVSGDSSIHISINGETISIGSTPLSSMDEFKDAMESMKEELTGHKIKLEDNYALASTYHDVKEYMDECGIAYTEKQLD